MKYNFIDTVGLAEAATNLYTSGTYPAFNTVNGTNGTGLVVNVTGQETYSAVFLGSNGGTAGTGTFVIQLQSSNDNKNWINEGTAGTLTIGTAIGISVDRPKYHFIRPLVSGVSAGTLVINAQILTKSDTFQ